MARTASTHSRSSAKRNRAWERWVQRGFSPADLLNLWGPSGACARRLYLTWADRALFVRLYRGFSRILDVITIIRPETIVRWHRKGFSAFWRWKSCATLSEE